MFMVGRMIANSIAQTLACGMSVIRLDAHTMAKYMFCVYPGTTNMF